MGNTPKTDEILKSVISLIDGKWKIPIIYTLVTKGDMQFNQILRELENISAHILSQQLKELTDSGIIFRMEFGKEINHNPPEVLYALTRKGASLIPILRRMSKWGAENIYSNTVDPNLDGPGLSGYPEFR